MLPLTTALLESNNSLKAFVGLAATSWAVLLPLTQIHPLYGISLGYGASVSAIAWVCGGAVVMTQKMLPKIKLNKGMLITSFHIY